MTPEEIKTLRAAIARKIDVSDNGEWTILCTGCGAHVGLEGPAEADSTPSYCTSCAYEYLDKALEAFKALEAVIELREGALGAMTQGADALAAQVRLLNAKLAAIREMHGTSDVCGRSSHDDPCGLCGILDCPLNEPGHHWKDGCPACVGEQLKREGGKL